MRLLLAILLFVPSAKADTLTINTADSSIYFIGTDLVVLGHVVSMAVTHIAQGDHPGQMFVDSFESEPWAWTLTLDGQEIDGSGLCTDEGAPPSLTLNCAD